MSGLSQYSEAARTASATVIAAYSTSFGLATRLLPPGMGRDIRCVYALVRVADEVVDGPGVEAGLDPRACARILDALEDEVAGAIAGGFSANLVVHAFAETARRVGIGPELTGPFFQAMRRDLSPIAFTNARELDDYIYGSAEVVGLMCVRCFLDGQPLPDTDARVIDRGARSLGRAFQLINFLRDLGVDGDVLGRAYLPGVDPAAPDAAVVDQMLDDLEVELRRAHAAIPLLPRGAQSAVAAAHDLFASLARRVRATPAAELPRRRISVPTLEKAVIVARAALTAGHGRGRDHASDGHAGQAKAVR